MDALDCLQTKNCHRSPPQMSVITPERCLTLALLFLLPTGLWACQSDARRVKPEHPYAEEIAALTELQFKVTQQDGTEPPFKNLYWDHKEAGIYVDIVSGEALFSSAHKYASGTGWPSFTRPIADDVVREFADVGIAGWRTEIRSAKANSHLGHVFTDGPKPTGLRYCINSAAIRFIPRDTMAAAGYEKFLADVPRVTHP